METLLHDQENAEDLTRHLKDNGEKFNRQCIMVLKLLYSGKRYTGKEVNEILDIACGDRRLRNLFAARKDIHRDWVYSEDGKRTKWKEYWLEIPKPITKTELIEKTNSALNNLRTVERNLVTVFELDENPPTFIQKKLFQ